MKVCCVFSLESSQWGDSNEYTQYTIFNVKKKITLNYPKSAAMRFYSKGLKSEFETAMVNEPSVFEALKFYCICNLFPNSIDPDKAVQYEQSHMYIYYLLPSLWILNTIQCEGSLGAWQVCFWCHRAIDKREYLVIIRDNFCSFCIKAYVVTLIWTISMRRFRWGVTTWFWWETRKIIIKYSPLSRALDDNSKDLLKFYIHIYELQQLFLKYRTRCSLKFQNYWILIPIGSQLSTSKETEHFFLVIFYVKICISLTDHYTVHDTKYYMTIQYQIHLINMCISGSRAEAAWMKFTFTAWSSECPQEDQITIHTQENSLHHVPIV